MDCGKGVQTRNVHCAQFDNDVIKPTVDESKCSADEKPESSKECDTGKECPGQWFTGPWSKCSKTCGGGQKSRKVLCIANVEAVEAKQCSEDSIAFANEDCNKEPCVDDEIIPVDTASKPIEADDEGEEYCDGDDDSSLEVIKSTLNDASATTTDDSDTTTSLVTEELMQSDGTGESSDITDSTGSYCKYLHSVNAKISC